ncbi:uncharacterized protein [Haliotis asinina]|uniref:uncharacterized protein n=1 Tax=Haliotis asinina TaxID=109174 RepID=UPI003532612C
MKTAFLILCFQVAVDFQQGAYASEVGLECYKCHKFDPHHPEDRCHIEHCHDGEFCELDIGLDNTVDGKCKHLNEIDKCLLDMQPMCIDYDSLLIFGKCRFCCGDANCVNIALNISDVPPVVTLPPTIPGTPDCVDLIPNCATTVNVCSSTNGQTLCKRFCNLCGGLPPMVIPPDAGLECYKCHKYDSNHPEDRCHVEHCHGGEFCQLDIGLDNTVDGKCKPRNELYHCLTEPHPLCNNYSGLFYGGCRFCCEDADCVNRASGAPSSTSTQSTTTTTTTATTTTTTTPAATLPPCLDLVDEHKCPTLPNICSNKLAGDICPEFCGLCQKVTPSASLPVCDSSAREDNCPLVPNVCSDKVAPYFCPEFCGFCARQGKGTTPSDATSSYSAATTVPSTAPSTTNPTTVGAGTCSDHSPVCSSIADICQRTFGLQLCEKSCSTCVSDNKTTGTTLAPSITPASSATTAVTSSSATAPTSTSIFTIATSTTTNSTSTTYSSTRSTVTSTVTTTKAPTAVHRSCYQCGNVDDGTYCTLQDIYIPHATSCPTGTNFCMTDIEQNIYGTTKYIKRCVNKQQCEKLWYQQTSDISECVDIDPTSLMSSVTCRYCCTTDNCNSGKVPASQHLYKPKH